MACVDDDEPPPEQLKTAWLCERWHTLPEDGGLYDQDARQINTMTALINIHTALTRLRNMRGAEIHNLSEQDRNILQMLVDMRLIFYG